MDCNICFHTVEQNVDDCVSYHSNEKQWKFSSFVLPNDDDYEQNDAAAATAVSSATDMAIHVQGSLWVFQYNFHCTAIHGTIKLYK